MKHKKLAKFPLIAFLFLFSAFALFFIIALLSAYSPLVPASEWEVKAESPSGKPLPAKIYKMMFHDDYFFVNTGGEWRTLEFNYGRFRIHTVPAPYVLFSIKFVDSPEIAGFYEKGFEERGTLSHICEIAVFDNGETKLSVKPKGVPWLDELEKTGPVPVKTFSDGGP